MEPITWALIAGCIILFLLYSHWKFNSHFKRMGIPADTALPLLGHFHKFFRKSFIQSLHNMQLKHGPIYGTFLGSSPTIIIADADMLKEILIRHFSHFHNRRDIKFDDYPMNKSLGRLKGARWKIVRNTIMPAFSASKMKPISLLINNCCDNLIKHMDNLIATNPDIEVKGLYGSLTMDTIAHSAFGLEIDSHDEPKDPFVEYAKSVVDLKVYSPKSFIALLFPQLAPIFNYFKIGLLPYKAKQFFLEVTTQALNLRKDGKRKFCLIPELVGNKEKDSHSVMKKELSMEELMAQGVVFFLAGYATMNVALSSMSYLLATNPDLQEKLYNEIQEVAATCDSLSYDVVNKMEYLGMFVNESLRLYPPGPVSDRICTEDITVNDIKFTKGSAMFYNIYSLHHDPKYWENPEKFDPERFSKDNKDKIHPFSYLPFGSGPRNCIGMRFALLVVKTTLARVVQKFRFEPCEKTQIPLTVGDKSTIPEEGVTLRVVARD